MRFCDRCGIEIGGRGLCADCAEITGGVASGVIVRRPYGNYRVNSGRRTRRYADDHKHLIGQVAQIDNMTATEAALRLGVSSRTIERARAELRKAT